MAKHKKVKFTEPPDDTRPNRREMLIRLGALAGGVALGAMIHEIVNDPNKRVPHDEPAKDDARQALEKIKRKESEKSSKDSGKAR